MLSPVPRCPLTEALGALGPGVQVPLEFHVPLGLHGLHYDPERPEQLRVDLGKGGGQQHVRDTRDTAQGVAQRGDSEGTGDSGEPNCPLGTVMNLCLSKTGDRADIWGQIILGNCPVTP